jgi:hypothetical protein
MNVDTTAWMIGVPVLVAFGALMYWLINNVSRSRIMRCPETGSVSTIQAALTAGGGDQAPRLTVTKCDLWPQKKGCAQECLSRYGESSGGFRVNLEALRPFEPRS